MTFDSIISHYVAQDFGTFAEMVGMQAQARPDHPAIISETGTLSYGAFDALGDRIAARLQRDGVRSGDRVAVCAFNSALYAALFLGTLRTGAAIAPMAPSATPDQLRAMITDCEATHIFLDAPVTEHLAAVVQDLPGRGVALEASAAGEPFETWLSPEGSRPDPVTIDPDQAFNIIYSSGTTGTPKGIVQSHRMRWAHINRNDPPGYGQDAVAMISTPLYSNTTLVSFLPGMAGGSTIVMMRKFDAGAFLRLADQYGATHAMLVPVQYRRILDHADFDATNLSRFVMKFATSAPFPAEWKAEVLRRWPGGLIEYYGMTEGGGSCALIAHEHPDKLDTVGRPLPGHDIRIIDEAGNLAAPGTVGELVGHSPAIMTGYHNQPDKTRETEWYSPDGARFIRTGDLASMDEDGFITLIGRKKDMIISGGFNIYPVDLEQVLNAHPSVRESAVIGVASDRWGETPMAFVTIEAGHDPDPEEIKRWANDRLGKVQRLSAVRLVDVLPRSAIGKILKRDLQDLVRAEEGEM